MVITLLILPVDRGIRVFMAASVWKVGGFIGVWFGVILGPEHGLEPEVAQRYGRHMHQREVVLALRARHRDLPGARGILLESGAWEARDVDGTFESKVPSITSVAARYG